MSVCPPSSSSAARSSSQDELCLAGSSLMEAMLGVNQDIVVVKVRCYSCADCVPLPEASHRPVSRRWFGSLMGS